MRRLIAGLILLAVNCMVIFGQQPDKSGPTLSTPTTERLLTSDQLPDVTSWQRSAPHSPSGQPQSGLFISPSDLSKTQEGSFVFQDGALYMRVAGQLLMPVSGGGASGCFNLYLPERIKNLKEFIPRLDSLERSRPAPQKAGVIF